MEAGLEKSRQREGAKKLDDLPKGLNEGRPNRTPVKEKSHLKTSHHLFYEMLVGRAVHSFNSQITRQKISPSSSK